MYNTQSLRRTSGGMDLGIISFFGTGVSSALLLRSSLGGKWRDKEQRFGCCGKKKEKREEDDLYLGSGGGGSNRRERDANAALSHAPPGTCLRGFALLTHVTVVANYLLGLLFALTAGSRIYYYFGTYCFTFSILWMVVAYAGWILVRVYRDAAAATYGKEILHNNGICASLWRELFATPMNYSRLGPGNNYNNQYYDEGEEEEDEEDEEIDEELRALYDGPKMGYSNA